MYTCTTSVLSEIVAQKYAKREKTDENENC